MKNLDLADIIVNEIINDLNSRQGFDFDGVDADEYDIIVKELTDVVLDILNKNNKD
jgi:hypothetical protein